MRFFKKMTCRKHLQQGFTLVEMAIVVLIAGLVVGSVFSFMSVQQDQQKQQITLDRQKKISLAMASFAQSNNRLPCPASWNVESDDATYGNALAACGTDALRKGIVPFRTLGLTVSDIVDGYNHPFTYVVAARAVSPTGNVHEKCRTADWGTSGNNYSPGKARFCCQQVVNPQIEIFNDNAATNLATNLQSITGSPMGDPGTIIATAPANHRLTYIAYLLISHGQSGDGFYILPSEDRTFSTARPLSNAGTGETENGNGTSTEETNLRFVAMPMNNGTGTTHYDDIVLWRTQEQVMSEFGNDSCAKP